MLSISDFETLRRAYSAYDDLTLDDVLDQIGNPSADAVVDFALSQMCSPDRNVRVLMLRILRHQPGERAMRAVLAGLQDESRRVCAVAIRGCPNYLEYPEIVARLAEIAKDASLKRKLRRRALSMLAGDEGRLQGDLTVAVFAALTRLMAAGEFGFTIVFGLARLDLAPRVMILLEEFARSEANSERQMAQRALDGERVIHIDAYSGHEALRQRIRQECEIAHGRMFYWLPRAGWPAITLPST